MNSLERHILQVRSSKHDESTKNKLIDLMTVVWKHLNNNSQPSTISSSVGGAHKFNSKHYMCMAFDINPDKGYSAEFVKEIQLAIAKSGYKVRVLVEFDDCQPGVKDSYRCTHIEFNNTKEGIYVLDYIKNTSSKMVV